jgi:hypothetical protein
MTKDELTRKLCGLLGICWHEMKIEIPIVRCSCGKEWHDSVEISQLLAHENLNPDFIADPRLVLREMIKRDDWFSFERMILTKYYWLDSDWVSKFTDTTGLFLKEAVEWSYRMFCSWCFGRRMIVFR